MEMEELMPEIKQWVKDHQNEMVKDIIRLVNIKSVSEPGEGGYSMGLGCKKCVDEFIELGKTYGFETENDDYYCASILSPGKTKKELGILGHLDVVPEGEGWHYEPYNAVEREGYIIGRGSSDNKGAVVMSLYVLRCMNDLGIHLNHTLRLIGGCNEESGMKDVEHYLKGHIPPEYTIVCDGGWAMCIGEKGILTADLIMEINSENLLELEGGIMSNAVPASAYAVLRNVPVEHLNKLRKEQLDVEVENKDGDVTVRVRGKAAHAFIPHTGENAIYKLLNILYDYELCDRNTLKKLDDLRNCFTDDYGSGLHINFSDELSGPTTCVGGMIRLDKGFIRQNINVRYAIKQSNEELLKQLKQRCDSLRIKIENLDYSAPRYTSVDHPVTQMLLKTCKELLEEQYEPYVMGGGTHARKFPNALPYGPNVMSGFVNPFGCGHGVDEAVCIEHLTQTIPVYIKALCQLDDYFSESKHI